VRRAVVTGMGIVSCLGNDPDAVAASLREGRPGYSFDEVYAEVGLRSRVSGRISLDPAELIDRKHYRFMNKASGYGYVALERAIADAGLDESVVKNPRTGLIVATGGPATDEIIDSIEKFHAGGVRKVGPYRVTKGMCSSISSVLATHFGVLGVNYSTTSACATSAHCIGGAVEQIQLGKQDVVFAGGADDTHWSLALQFDAMGALSSAYNDDAEHASRPYDANRDGFVIAGGAGILIVEELEHALARGARIHGEIVGYAATSDGYHMVQPSGEGAVRSMRIAMEQAGNPRLDYINAHGTGTPVGDVAELGAMRELFGDRVPPVSSTKSLSGHSLGAAGVHEAIYSLLMMRDGFIAASANIDTLDPEAGTCDIVTERREAQLDHVLSNSFGFGGTNASLLFARYGD
jgi:3-oxoacyl-[acyl-carrier-protein] synthase-1